MASHPFCTTAVISLPCLMCHFSVCTLLHLLGFMNMTVMLLENIETKGSLYSSKVMFNCKIS